METKVELDDEIQVELDLGNLCVASVISLKSSLDCNFSEKALIDIAGQATQRLMQEILKLPSEYHEHVLVAKLPEPTALIPREKPVPKPKPLTKWEAFSRKKGIQKQKKEKLVWNENTKDWEPQYGYRGAINNKNDWMVEIPNTPKTDPNADYFGKKKGEKKENVAKNEYMRLRNVAASRKLKVTNMETVDRADKQQISRSLAAAKSATASVGRFTDKLPKEKAPKNNMKKRNFKSNIPDSMMSERENNLKILQQLDKKRPKLDIQEAVQLQMTKTVKPARKDGGQKKKFSKKRDPQGKNFKGAKKRSFK